MSNMYRNWNTMSEGGIMNWFLGITCSWVTRSDSDWVTGKVALTEDSEVPMRRMDGYEFTKTIREMREFLLKRHEKAQFVNLYDEVDDMGISTIK